MAEAAAKKQTQKKIDDKYIENIMKRVPKSLLELQKFVVPKISSCWDDIATQLHFTKEQINEIDKNIKPTRVEECCKEMLLKWKEQTKEASADTLIEAIEEAENAAYADELRKEVEKKVDILSDEYLKANVTRRIATVWETVGLYLKIHSDDLSTIKQLTNPSGDKCRQMLLIWLKRNQADASKSPTWKNMYKAMCSLDMIRPAEILQEELLQKYPNIN